MRIHAAGAVTDQIDQGPKCPATRGSAARRTIIQCGNRPFNDGDTTDHSWCQSGGTAGQYRHGLAWPRWLPPPPPKPGAERTTGDEDELDDLTIERRTAPSDLGTTPLPSPGAPLGSESTQPVSANPLLVVGPIARPGARGPLRKVGVARTTGDEDEMDDLDIPRRTAPSDLGITPLPSFDAPLVGPRRRSCPGARSCRLCRWSDCCRPQGRRPPQHPFRRLRRAWLLRPARACA